MGALVPRTRGRERGCMFYPMNSECSTLLQNVLLTREKTEPEQKLLTEMDRSARLSCPVATLCPRRGAPCGCPCPPDARPGMRLCVLPCCAWRHSVAGQDKPPSPYSGYGPEFRPKRRRQADRPRTRPPVRRSKARKQPARRAPKALQPRKQPDSVGGGACRLAPAALPEASAENC